MDPAPVSVAREVGSVARVVRCMRRMRVIPVMPIMMRLSGRAGKEKGGGGDQSRRGQTNDPADSRPTVTQRHERALFNSTQPLGPRRSQLRNSHGRERYGGAVTLRLTRGHRADGFFSPSPWNHGPGGRGRDPNG